MRDFCGRMAGQLPRCQCNVVCFQYVRVWQWQGVAGLCHAHNLLKAKGKSSVVADGWQGSTNVHSAALLPQRGGVSERAPATDKNRGSKNTKTSVSIWGRRFQIDRGQGSC